MKRVNFPFLLVIFISIIIPCKGYTIDITAGMTSWFAWGEQKSSGANSNPVMQSSPAFLFGPTLAVKLSEKFSLTFVYLYGGKFYYEDKDEIAEKFKSKRSDADLALNYRINDYFKIFGGIKYLSYDMMQVRYTPSGGSSVTYENDGKHTVWGGGLGLTATFSVAENLFLLATLSGFRSVNGQDKISQTDGGTFSFEHTFEDYCINSSLSMAYYITSASTAISLGGRYQYFKTKYGDDNLFNGIAIKNTIYGVTLSATYSFNI